MPILWRYLIKSYFQSCFLCIFAFIAVLLVIRFQGIALFVSSGAGLSSVGLFSLYQIPYILPLAIPISCLIAAMMLFQRMSSSLELTALRASGIGLSPITYPILVCALILSLLNFTIVSELTPIARTKAKNLIYKIASENPLIALQKDSILDVRTVEFDVKSLHLGKKAKEVLCVFRQGSSDRIGIFTAKELSVNGDFIQGTSISILSSAPSENEEGYDHLIIENQKTMQSNKSIATQTLFSSDWFAREDLFSFKHLLEKCKTESSLLTSGCFLELIRRSSLGFCPFTFTLLGIAFGTTIGRYRRKMAVLSAFSWAAAIMVCFVASKTVQKSPVICFLLYSIPQTLALLYSLKSLSLSSKGVE